MSEINKRLLTSIFLLTLLVLAFLYSFILIILLILISLFSWIEFNGLFNKIFVKSNIRANIFRSVLRVTTLFYLVFFSATTFNAITNDQYIYKLITLYLLFVCIFSDVGGYIFGKTFKGKKLTKLSPKKTIAGSIGSFILPFILVPIFLNIFPDEFNNFINLILITIVVSFVCQVGDLFISLLKRKANVKDTGDLLPGHGGILDRIDGIVFAVPFGIILSRTIVF